MRRSHDGTTPLSPIRVDTVVGGAAAALLADQAGVVVGVLVVLVVAMTTLRASLRATALIPVTIGAVVLYELLIEGGLNRRTTFLAVPLWIAGEWAARHLVARLRNSSERQWHDRDQGGLWVTPPTADSDGSNEGNGAGRLAHDRRLEHGPAGSPGCRTRTARRHPRTC